MNRFSRLPFVMITAEAERHRIMEAIAREVSDLLVKPYTTGHSGRACREGVALESAP